MILEIKNITVYIISPAEGKYKERILILFNKLISEGFQNIVFVKSLKGPNNTASLTNTVIEIFKREMDKDTPFIILEDDCNFFYKYDTIEVPDNYDLLYIGISYWTFLHPIHTLFRKDRPYITINSSNSCSSYNDTLVKIKSMTSGHAIVYKSRTFMKLFIDFMYSISKTVDNLPHDLLFACLHKLFNVYGLKKPMFYQDELLGGQQNVTKLIFNGECYR